MHSWIAICRDKNSVSAYHFTCPQTGKDRALAFFKRMVASNDWEPFDEVEVAIVNGSPAFNVLKKIASIIIK